MNAPTAGLRIANLLGFQLVWFAAVVGAGQGLWWSGPLALLPFALWQLGASSVRRADLVLLISAAVFGFALDTLWVQLDWMRFSSPTPSAQFAPLWIVAMWMAFALTLNHSLAALRQHLLPAALLGLLGGPFAYWVAASAWGAVEIDGVEPYVALGLAWALATPALLLLAGRLCRPAQWAAQ